MSWFWVTFPHPKKVASFYTAWKKKKHLWVRRGGPTFLLSHQQPFLLLLPIFSSYDPFYFSVPYSRRRSHHLDF